LHVLESPLALNESALAEPEPDDSSDEEEGEYVLEQHEVSNDAADE